MLRVEVFSRTLSSSFLFPFSQTSGLPRTAAVSDDSSLSGDMHLLGDCFYNVSSPLCPAFSGSLLSVSMKELSLFVSDGCVVLCNEREVMHVHTLVYM